LDTEALLLAKLRAGDTDAWEDLVRQYGNRMYNVARRLLRTEDDSADAVQEAFLCLVRSLDSFEGRSRLWTWLYRILANICLGKLRARSRRHTVPIGGLLPAFDHNGAFAGADGRQRRLDCWPGKADHPENEPNRHEIQAQVRGCIDLLAEPYRTVLILRDMEELDTEETGRLLGLSLGAVKTRLHRARQALRTLLEPHMAKTSS